MIPTSRPSPSVTGTRRTCSRFITEKTSRTVWLSLTVATSRVMYSRTVAFFMSFPSAPARMAMSRSVMTPRSRYCSRSSTTGMIPTSRSRIRRATSASEVSGVTASGFAVMRSPARVRCAEPSPAIPPPQPPCPW
jgi:hypothetical protein